MRLKPRRINYILIIITYILVDAALPSLVKSHPLPGRPLEVLNLLFCLFGLFLENKKSFGKKQIQVFIFIAVYLFIYIVCSRYNIITYLAAYYLFVLFFFVFSYILQKNGSYQEFLDIYENAYVILGLITVFFWLFGSNFHIIPAMERTSYAVKGVSRVVYNYYYLYFEIPVQNQNLFGLRIPRNCGIYREAPGYASALLFAVGVELFTHKDINKKKLACLLLTLLSNQSTKAYVILIVLFGVRYIITNHKKSRGNLASKLPIIMVLVPIGLAILRAIMIDKQSTGTSFDTRYNSLQAGFRTWLEHPIFGAGYGNSEAIYENQIEGLGVEGKISMGITVLLARGGLYLFSFYVIALLYAYKNNDIKRNKLNYFQFALMMFMELFISNSAFGLRMKFLLGSGFAAGSRADEIDYNSTLDNTKSIQLSRRTGYGDST